MATRIIPIGDWRKIDKSGWHKLIRAWNQRKGFMKKVSRPIGVRTAYLSPNEERQMVKRRKVEKKKQTAYVANLAWDDVPQRIPYLFGSQEAALSEEKRRVKHPDKNMVYVDASFWELTKVKPRPITTHPLLHKTASSIISTGGTPKR